MEKYKTRGYASHSFNQLVKEDNNKFVTIDHGDAFPRAVRLVSDNKVTDIYKFTSKTYMFSVSNYNLTGATANDLAVTDNNYLACEYVDNDVVNGETYYYTIKAYRLFDKKKYSAFNKTGWKFDNVQAVDLVNISNQHDGIMIEYNSYPNAGKYHVYRKTENTSWEMIGTTTGTDYFEYNIFRQKDDNPFEQIEISYLDLPESITVDGKQNIVFFDKETVHGHIYRYKVQLIVQKKIGDNIVSYTGADSDINTYYYLQRPTIQTLDDK